MFCFASQVLQDDKKIGLFYLKFNGKFNELLANFKKQRSISKKF